MCALAVAICTTQAAWLAHDVRAHGADTADALSRPSSHENLLRQTAKEGSVVVALFSLTGCAYCEAIREEQLSHLAREAKERRLRVVEYGIDDRRPFEPPRQRANGLRSIDREDAAPGSIVSYASPAALAEALKIRVAPTVVFIGPGGNEVAERLVGYGSPDFYGAYLEQRVAQARERSRVPAQ